MHIGILVYNGARALDVVGPMDVFSAMNDELASKGKEMDNIFLIGEKSDKLRLSGIMPITPTMTYDATPELDILVVPGGNGGGEGGNPSTLRFITEQYSSGLQYLIGVCTGALVVAETGLLGGREATTHPDHLNKLERKGASVVRDVPYIRDENIITTRNVLQGIEGCLYAVRMNYGAVTKGAVAHRLGR